MSPPEDTFDFREESMVLISLTMIYLISLFYPSGSYVLLTSSSYCVACFTKFVPIFMKSYWYIQEFYQDCQNTTWDQCLHSDRPLMWR